MKLSVPSTMQHSRRSAPAESFALSRIALSSKGNMKRPVRAYSIAQATIAILVIFIFGLVSVDETNADCGDWLVHGHASRTMTPDASLDLKLDYSPQLPSQPCDGPQCQGSKPLTPATTTSANRVEYRKTPNGHFHSRQFEQALPTVRSLPTSDNVFENDDRFRIDRPPQCVA